MSILERIRKNSAIAVGAIGLALALFVITDALNSNTGLFGNSSANRNNVGEIDGEQISIKTLEAKTDEKVEQYKQRSNEKTVNQSTIDMLREQTWTELVQQTLYTKEYVDLGLTVTSDELADMFYGENIHPQVKQSFTDPKTGVFDKNIVIRSLKNISEGTDEKVKKQVTDFEDYLEKDALTRKYNSLLKKGVYVTAFEAKARFTDRKSVADVDLIVLPYFSIADSTIKIDESEIKSFFKKNSDKYKEKENSRKMEFVLFDVVPTKEDTDAINKWVNEQVVQFAESKNDTIFVDLNSDTKFDTTAKPLSAFPEEVQNQLFSQPVSSIVGPIYQNGKFSIYKVSGIKEDTVYQMRASHILFKVENFDTAATIKKANEVMSEIKKGASFAEKATQFGTDGTSSRGGDLGWFREGQMVKAFNDAILRGSKGDMFVLKTQFGIHIVKITENKTKKLVCAGMLDRSIVASTKTVNGIYSKASQFAAASQSVEDFDKNISEKNYTKRTADNIRENDKSIAGLPDAREVVRWAYNAKKDDVSDIFSIGEKYIICVLAQIKEKDKANFEDAKDRVETDFRKEKKAEMLMEKATTAMAGSANLQDIAGKLKTPVTPVKSLTFESGNIPYIGPDNSFAGNVFGTATIGKILGPIKGDGGVYIYNKLKTDCPKIENEKQIQTELQMGLSQKMESASFEALKDLRKVKDNRFMFY
jgi:peptidyl-prolyl cis-trans isomerase D